MGGGPVRDPDEHGDHGDVLLSYLYQNNALAYCFAGAGPRPVDSRGVSGSPDAWIRLPDRDYWN